MPRQVYKIINFSGGINDNADPRDLLEGESHEFVELQGMTITKPGQLLLAGIGTGDYKTRASTMTANGYGFLVIDTDYSGFQDASSMTSAGQVYYIIEGGSNTLVGKGTVDESGNIPGEFTNLSAPFLIWNNGALRVYNSDHDTAFIPQWRGYIKQVQWGPDLSADNNQYGHVVLYDTGWRSVDAPASGCFEAIKLSANLSELSTEGQTESAVTVGRNLIAGDQWKSEHKGVGGGSATGEGVARLFGFGNEDVDTGTLPGEGSGPSAMRWGMGLQIHPTETGSGSWAPTGKEGYQFYATTMYDEHTQESEPQLFTMYDTKKMAQDEAGAANQWHGDSAFNSYLTSAQQSSNLQHAISSDGRKLDFTGTNATQLVATDAFVRQGSTTPTFNVAGAQNAGSFQNSADEYGMISIPLSVVGNEQLFLKVKMYSITEDTADNGGIKISLNTSANAHHTDADVTITAGSGDHYLDQALTVAAGVTQVYLVISHLWNDEDASANIDTIEISSKSFASASPVSSYRFMNGDSYHQRGSNVGVTFSPVAKWIDVEYGDQTTDSNVVDHFNFGATAADWAGSTPYVVGDKSYYLGKYYNCKNAHTSTDNTDSTTGRPVNATNSWEETEYGGSSKVIGATGNPRISGVKFYWASSEDGFSRKYLLMDWYFKKGVKAIGSSDSTAGGDGGYIQTDSTFQTDFKWQAAGDTNNEHFWYQHVHGNGINTGDTSSTSYGLGFWWEHPPTLIEYSSVNHHSPDDNIKVQSFKAGVIANEQFFIGNVKQDGIIHGDKILVSPPSQFDKFPEGNDIPVVVNDGDEIIHMEEYSDRLLVFKKSRLFIINVSSYAAAIIESDHMHKGLSNPGAACKTDNGIAWINSFGCYFYNGESVTSLLESGNRLRINESTWSSFIGSNGRERIGYNPTRKELIVIGDSTNIYSFNTISGGWSYSAAVLSNNGDHTNSRMLNDPDNGILIWADDSADRVKQWSDTATAQAISILTKDIDFGEPGLKKSVYSVKISYQGDGSTLTVLWGKNGTTPARQFNSDNTPLTSSGTGDWAHVELKPTTAADSKNIYSFQIKISGTPGADFKINDISIVYRLIGVR